MIIKDEAAEKGVLGACLVGALGGGKTLPIDTAMDAGCDVSWFSLAKHRLLWEAMVAVHTDGKPVDMVTVGTLTKDYDFINELVDSTPTIQNLPSYLTISEQHSKRRLIYEIAMDAQEAVSEADVDVSTVIAKVGDRFDSIVSTRERKTLREHMLDNIKVLRDNLAGKMSGLPLPWGKFSNLTGGVQAQSATPLVGRDGKGKSGACAQIADYWAGEDIPTLYISLEDAPRRTLLRMAGCRKWFSARDWEMGSSVIDGKRVILSNSEGNRLESRLLEYTDWLEERRVEVVDGDFTGEQVAAEVVAFRRRHGIKDEEVIGVIVDGFKDLEVSGGDGTTAQEKHTALKLQKGAKRGNAGMLVVSHINKIHPDMPITKEDITGSGAQFKGARQVLIFQDSGIEGRTDNEDEFVMSATKANFANGGSAHLRRDESVFCYQEL